MAERMALRIPEALVSLDSERLANAAGLRWVSDDEPGIARVRRGAGFSYHRADGTLVSGRARERLQGLAVPPAWTDVWLCEKVDGHLLATGRDDAGRKQHRYHPEFRVAADRLKFARLRHFARGLPELRRHLRSVLLHHDDGTQLAVAAALSLIDQGLVRVGNDRSAADGHHGATTLTHRHLRHDEGGAVFEFVGKSGAQRHIVVHDETLVDALDELAAIESDRMFVTTDDAGVEHPIGAADLNQFLGDRLHPCFTARVFRTWGGSAVAMEARANGCDAIGAADAAAEILGNTRAVARASYVHPLVLSAEENEIDRAWSASRAGSLLSRSESALTKLLDAGEASLPFADADAG